MASPSSQDSELDRIYEVMRKDPQTALSMCEDFLARNNDHPQGLLGKFSALQSLNRPEDALQTALHMVQVEPDDDLNHYLVSEQSYRLGRYDDAIASGLKAIELNENGNLGNMPHRVIAMAYAQKGDLQTALEYPDLMEKAEPGEWGIPGGIGTANSREDFIQLLHNTAAKVKP